jgi:hypothetical protein
MLEIKFNGTLKRSFIMHFRDARMVQHTQTKVTQNRNRNEYKYHIVISIEIKIHYLFKIKAL